MSSDIYWNTFDKLLGVFATVKKRIIKKELSTNPDTLDGYKRDIIQAHDNIVDYARQVFDELDNENKLKYREKLIYIRDKIIECFGRLSLNVVVSRDLLARIDENKIAESDDDEDEDLDETVFHDSDDINLHEFEEIFGDLLNSYEFTELIPRSTRRSRFEFRQYMSGTHVYQEIFGDCIYAEHFEEAFFKNRDKMTLTKVEFLKLATAHFKRIYEGDPLGLDAFIDSIDLLRDYAENEDLKTTLIKLVKANLGGKARECIPREPQNIDEIITGLRSRIKPDNSKVIMGRMLALRLDRSKMTEFSTQADQLSEALERSLIIEGISQDKAREMTVEKSVELCRNLSRSDLVKSVLAATRFDSPKDVFSKFIVEADTETKEKQILAYRQMQKRDNPRGRGSKNGKSNYNNRGKGGYQNNYNGNSQNGYNNKNGNYRGNGRGRGGGRGRGNYNNYNSNNYQEHNIRYTENAGGPQDWRANQNNQSQQGQRQNYQIPFQNN